MIRTVLCAFGLSCIQWHTAVMFAVSAVVSVALFGIFEFDVHGAAPDVSAVSAVVIENSTGKIIFEKNAHCRLPMASTTKIMTAICALEHSHPYYPVTISDDAVGIEGSSIYLVRGETLLMGELIKGMMLNSGNDAATAIAIEVGGSVEGFAEMMNQKAEKLGAEDTNFVNACGLWEADHYTTAYDLSRIAAYGLTLPFFAETVSTYETTISNGDKPYPRVLKNHNRLLKLYEGCTGVKTGYTKKCGRCLVSSAQRDGVSLTAVTLNDPNDWNDHMAMLDYGFSRVVLKTPIKENDYCRTVEVREGGVEGCILKFARSMSYVSVGDGEEKVEIKYEIPEFLNAPILSGQVVGRAVLYADGKEADSSDVVCDTGVPALPKTFFSKAVSDNIKKFLGLYSLGK